MKKMGLRFGVLLTALMPVLLLSTGCERTATDRALRVSPSNARVQSSEAVTFEVTLPEGTDGAREILYPLEWRVSNPELGTIRSSGGNTAVYVAGRQSGSNAIVVRDQAGAEGVASIVQTSAVASGGGS